MIKQPQYSLTFERQGLYNLVIYDRVNKYLFSGIIFYKWYDCCF